MSPTRLDELAVETSKLFPLYLKESFYTKATLSRSAAGTFQTYYGKRREKKVAIGRLKISTVGKRKRAEEGNSTLRYECDETFSDECEFAARAEGE